MDDKIAPILNKIAQLLSKDEDYPIDRTLLYANVEPGVVKWDIFKDLGNHIFYRIYNEKRGIDDDVVDALLDLWDEAPADRRWVDIEFFVHDGRFDATFVYPDQMGGRRGYDRRDEVLLKYYGEKPLLYPPWPDDPAETFTLSPPGKS